MPRRHPRPSQQADAAALATANGYQRTVVRGGDDEPGYLPMTAVTAANDAIWAVLRQRGRALESQIVMEMAYAAVSAALAATESNE